MAEPQVLFVGDDPLLQMSTTRFLETRGYRPIVARSIRDAFQLLARETFCFTVLDLVANGHDPMDLDLVRRLRLQPGNPGALIGVVDRTEIQDATESVLPLMNAVVYKPLTNAEFDTAISAIALPPTDASAPVQEEGTVRIRREMNLWQSPAMREVKAIIQEAAGIDITVLITGETGAGKDLVARAIHHLSARRSGPFVKVNCAAVPHDLLESEWFGYERGAFTGAHKLKIGKFESAHRGTIFLDEIGDLHPELQGKLLHVLQDGEFSRIGGKSSVKVDVRVIAATNQNLEQAANERRFREDLYYRLNVIQVDVPPLRERPEDVPALIDYFVHLYSRLFRRDGFSIPPSVVERLAHHRFPGNVRQLENVVKRMIVLGDPFLARVPLDGGTPAPSASAVTAGAARPLTNPLATGGHISLKEIGRTAALAAQRDAITHVLQQAGWNRGKAAKTLNMSYRALLYKMKETGLANSPRPGSA